MHARRARAVPEMGALPLSPAARCCRYGRGKTVAYDLSRALNALHAKVGPWMSCRCSCSCSCFC